MCVDSEEIASPCHTPQKKQKNFSFYSKCSHWVHAFYSSGNLAIAIVFRALQTTRHFLVGERLLRKEHCMWLYTCVSKYNPSTLGTYFEYELRYCARTWALLNDHGNTPSLRKQSTIPLFRPSEASWWVTKIKKKTLLNRDFQGQCHKILAQILQT